jgi:hypothetical protein
MNKRAQIPKEKAEGSIEPQASRDEPEYLRAVRARRRHLRISLAGAGGLSPGVHGIMTTDEDVFGIRLLGPDWDTAENG